MHRLSPLRMTRSFSLALSAYIIAVTLSLPAQVTSRLTGSVVDPTGAAVAGAIVDVQLQGGTKPVASMPTTMACLPSRA